MFEQRCEGITAVKSVGASILLGQIFDAFGFNAINDELFRKLVLSRLCYRVSKLNPDFAVEFLNQPFHKKTKNVWLYPITTLKPFTAKAFRTFLDRKIVHCSVVLK